MPEKRTSGSFPEDSAAAEKNAADKTLGNRALSAAAGSRSVPAGHIPGTGEPFRLWMAPTAYRGLAALYGLQRPVFFGRGLRTAKFPPHGLPAKQNDRGGKAREAFL